MTRFPNGVSSFVYTQGAIKALPQSTTGAIATVTGGRILLLGIFGKITTVVQAQATTFKYSHLATGLAAVDLCATVDLNAAAVGTTVQITGTLASAAVASVNGVFIFQATPIVLTTGTLSAITVASSTGNIQYTFLWSAIDPAAKLVAA